MSLVVSVCLATADATTSSKKFDVRNRLKSISIVFTWVCFPVGKGLLPGVNNPETFLGIGRSVPVRRALISAGIWGPFPLSHWLEPFLQPYIIV